MTRGAPQGRTILRFVGGVQVGSVQAVSPAEREELCDYCGVAGCQWQRHPQAWVDVEAWRRQSAAENG